MAKDPAFLFYPGDYLRDTQCLSTKAQVAYDRIMCEHMRTSDVDSANIIVSKKQVMFFCKRLSEDEIDDLMHVLVKKDDDFQIEWVAESIAKRRQFGASRSKNRSSKPKETSKNTSSHMEDEDENVNEDVNTNAKAVLEFLNEFAERRFGINEANLKFVRARLNDGRTVDELKGVIIIKTVDWKLNPSKYAKENNMKKYLQPSTLFNSTKFEGYYNEFLDAKLNPQDFKNEQRIKKAKEKPTNKNVSNFIASVFG